MYAYNLRCLSYAIYGRVPGTVQELQVRHMLSTIYMCAECGQCTMLTVPGTFEKRLSHVSELPTYIEKKDSSGYGCTVQVW